MSVDYLLHESAVGYAIFKVAMQPDTVGNSLKEVQSAANDLAKFGKMVKLVSFAPFQGAAQALENANDVSEGIVSEYLHTFLDANLPKADKKNKVSLGVTDKALAGSIKEIYPKIQCETSDTSEVVADMLRGLRTHGQKLLKQLQDGDVDRASLGLGHSYSRSKVKFSVNRNDNHIIQSIALLDFLDKSVNTFSMRVREWYGWHFPELVKLAPDNATYARLALFIGDKSTLTDDSLHDLAALVNDDAGIAQQIIDTAKVSMGQDISEQDMDNVRAFAKRTSKLTTYRKNLANYLAAKMGVVAPNLSALIGDVVGARLIAKAGSLTNLAKAPASTVQILGAEKALFRALKTKGNTPKYGLIYHSSFIGRAGAKNKGRISRFLANKCSIASRIDNFSETPSTKFGEALKAQVEERLEFYSSGVAPTKNADAMKAAMDSVLGDIAVDDGDSDEEMAEALPLGAAPETEGVDAKAAKKMAKAAKKAAKEGKEGKKEKKRKQSDAGVVEDASEKKKDKKKKHKHGKE